MTQIQNSSWHWRRATNALREFATRFQVEVATPIAFDECPGSVAFGFVPHFGSPKGVLLDSIEPPTYEGDNALEKYAYGRTLYYSQVNVEQLANYGEADFIEMFRDWGYYGDSPPSWLIDRDI